MKTLYLIRHAKSSWKFPHLSDFDRPLKKRGIREAPLMGAVLKQKGIQIDHILSSPANRAISTAKLVAKELGYPSKDIEQIKGIYHAYVSDLLKIVQTIDDQHTAVCMFGHNPGFTDLTNLLSGSNIFNVPTTGVCCIQFEVDTWKKVAARQGRLVFFEYPKLYRDD